MKKISKETGRKIRQYRQAKKLTLENMAALLHKSKSTVSKYETGEIVIDIEVLYEIASILHLPVSFLLAEEEEDPDEDIAADEEKMSNIYCYLYDGRTNSLLRALICHSRDEKGRRTRATWFYNIRSFDEPGKCRALYTGEVQKKEYVVNYSFRNQTNPIEKANICFLNSIEHSEWTIGMLTGLSSKTMLPVAARCILSDHILKEDEVLLNTLKLTKEDLKLTKKLNMFTIDV